METTIKSKVSVTVGEDGLAVVNYKRGSMLLGVLMVLSIALTFGLCFVLIGFILIPIPLVLLLLFYLVQVQDDFKIKVGAGLILKRHQIAFHNISTVRTSVNRGIATVMIDVKGSEVVVANLLRESVANEIHSLILQAMDGSDLKA